MVGQPPLAPTFWSKAASLGPSTVAAMEKRSNTDRKWASRIRARWLTAMEHFEDKRKRVKTSKTYLLSGIKRKINTERRMEWEKRGTCGDAGRTGGLAHSVTPKRHRCQSHTRACAHTHAHTQTICFSKHIPAAEVGYGREKKEQKLLFFPSDVRGK